MAHAVCPLCDSTTTAISLGENGWRYTCPTCGIFEMWDFAMPRSGIQAHWEETRQQLSKAARKASDEGDPLHLRDEESILQAIAIYHVGAFR